MRLIIHPRPPDMGCWRVLEEFLFNGVLEEPGDGGQPPGHGGAGAASGFQLAGEALDVAAADSEQDEGAGTAPSSELAQVECVGLAGQAAVPGQETASASRSGSVKAGWIVASAVDGAAVVIGHLPAGLERGRLGQFRSQRLSGNPP